MQVPEKLKAVLLDRGCCGVLFSGGFDSEVLLGAAVRILGVSNVVSLTADTGLLAEFYRKHIAGAAAGFGIDPIFVPLNILASEEFLLNTDKRCYFCKKKLYTRLMAEAIALGCTAVMDGTNMDDLGEYRPGLIAADETGIVHPFVEASMGRREIIELGNFLGIMKLPSDSCLATRIPSGKRISSELLSLIERMEAPLRPLARGRFRVVEGYGRLHVNYSPIDEKPVEENLSLLKQIAEKSGYTLELNRLES